MKKKIINILKYVFVIATVLGISRFILFRDKVKAVPVRKVEQTKRVVEKTISVSGEVKTHKSVELTFGSSSGKVYKIHVSEGDSVKKGQLLASLDSSTSSYSLQTYVDARDVAIKDKQIYVENYETNMSAVGGEDEYRLNIARLDELVNKAEATLNAQASVYKDLFIYAPFDGVVLDVTKKEGDSAIAFEKIIKISDVNELYFEVDLDQDDFGSVKLGQDVKIDLDSFDNRVFTGKIAKLPQFANGGASPSFTIEIAFDQNQEGLLLGMTGDAKIIAETTTVEAPSLLYDEINYDEEDKPYVWVVRGKVLVKKYVEIGLEGDIYTEIKTDVGEDVYVPVGDVKIEEGFNATVQK